MTVNPRQKILNPRQLECLYWIAMGKNKPITALIMGVTKNQVDYTLKSIRQELNAFGNGAHMVTVAFSQEILLP